MSNIYYDNKVLKAASSAQVTATGTGDLLDVADYEDVKFVISSHISATADASNKFVFGVEEGDAVNLSDAVAVADPNRVFGSAVINNINQDHVVLTLGVQVGLKKYMRLTWTETGTADATFSAVAVLGCPRRVPAQT